MRRLDTDNIFFYLNHNELRFHNYVISIKEGMDHFRVYYL